MHCARFDHIPPFSSVIYHGYTFTTVWMSKSELVCAIKQQGLTWTQLIVIKLPIQKEKTEMSHREDSAFSKTAWEKSWCKSSSFSSTWWKLDSADATASDSICVTPFCALCGRENLSGLFRTLHYPHHPFMVLGNCSVQSLTQKSGSNSLWTLRIYPKPNWWLVGLIFKWPADLIVLSNRWNVFFFRRCLAWPFVGAPTAMRCQACTCWGSWSSRVSGRSDLLP